MLTAQLPQAMQVLHCRMGGALDGSSVVNLFNSISYGINFDVKDANNMPYCRSSAWSSSAVYQPGDLATNNGVVYNSIAPNNSNHTPSTSPVWWQATGYSPLSLGSLGTADMNPDQYRATEIQNPSQFILISEATTQSPESLPQPFPKPLGWLSSVAYIVGDIVSYNNVVYTCIAPNTSYEPAENLSSPHRYWKRGYWTGGRISMGDTTSNGTGYERTSTDSPPHNAPIVGRHGGYANVLFADWHVEAIQIVPGQTAANRNINYNTPLWTLPGR